MNWFTRNGQALFYEDSGEVELAPLVLVHGLACDLSDWDAQAQHFRGRRRVVRIDQRGHGRSLGFDDGFDMLQLGADLAGLLEHLHLRAAALAGHSLGCRVVMQAATLAPERVAALVLVDGSRFASGSASEARGIVRAQVAAAGQRAMAHKLFSQMFNDASDSATRRRIVDRALRIPEPQFVSLIAEMSAWDAEHFDAATASLPMPVLVQQSTHVNEARERVPLEPGDSTPYLDALGTRVANIRIEILPGVGHFTMIDAAASVNAQIDSFLS